MLKLAFPTELDAQRGARLMGYDKSALEVVEGAWILPLAHYRDNDDTAARIIINVFESRRISARLVVDTLLEKKPF